MTWYLIAKMLHVMSAILWLGGALLMVILGAVADRTRNDQEIVSIVRQVSWAAERIYIPASVATLIFGIIATSLGGLWGQLWVILGLIGIAATIAIGVAVLTPRVKRAQAGFTAGGVTPAVVAQCREILTIAKFDMVLLFVIVADMVLKPQLENWVTLLLMAAVIGAAGYVWLSPLRTRGAAATA